MFAMSFLRHRRCSTCFRSRYFLDGTGIFPSVTTVLNITVV